MDAGEGRSPLARGRPGEYQQGDRGAGSIPARAGQTCGWRASMWSVRVDPRSRGADRLDDWREVVEQGRSPLARGRPCRSKPRRVGVGSIPARAGQTHSRAGAVSKPGVDPRSRGADYTVSAPHELEAGRSPLARGRPGPPARQALRTGSIPARAGQTSTWSPARCTRRVDPRSRGADVADELDRRDGQGRSPLARGRLNARRGEGQADGSIPARAGQTGAGRSGSLGSVVDPRSRGADAPSTCSILSFLGRSPLARGRRVLVARACARQRSIPARAGQTFNQGSGAWLDRVDPRSRGADAVKLTPKPTAMGRSPLARGRRCPCRTPPAQ